MIEMLERTVAAVSTDEQLEKNSETLDPRVLSSVLVSVKLAQSQDENIHQDPHARLLELMHSSPVKALLDAAVVFAKREGIAPHEGLQQIVMGFQEIDRLWNKVLIKEGLARLSSQYH